MANETVAAGVSKVLAAAKSIRNRYATRKLTSLLAADRKAIEQGLIEIGDADVPFIITSSKSNATPLPGAPAASDTLAPNQPTGLTVTEGADRLTWSWDASFDHYDGSVTASGVKEYDLEIDGSTTVVSTANTSILPAPTFAVIGSVSPPPSFSQSGDSLTMTCAGTGIDGTADECAFLYWTVNGDFKLNVRVDSFTGGGGGEYAPAGLMVRESTAAGSIYTAMYQWFSALSRGVQHKKRTATDGAKTTGVAASGNDEDRWLQIERSGSTFTYRYSIDGGAWTTLASETVSMSSTVLIGAFCSDLQVSPVVLTATFLQLGYVTVSNPSYVQVTTGSHTARVRSRDKATPGNVSTWSPSVTGVVASGEKKFTPGQYIRADAQGYPSKDTQHYATYDKALPYSNIKGCEIPVNWYRTNPSSGQYDWSYIDAHINRITENRTNNKKVLLTTQFQNYGGSVPSYPYNGDDATLPNFILQAGWGATRTTGGVMPKLDISGCMDALIAWIEAIGARYDSDPYVDLFTVGETSSAYSGWNAANYATQWNRLPAVLAAAFPNTFTCISHNGLTSPTTSIALNALMVSNGVGLATEDAAPFYGSEPTQYGNWGYYAYAGVGTYDDGGGNGTVNYGTVDSRLTSAVRAEQQVIRSDQITLAQVNAIMNNHWKNTHSVWAVYFDASGNSYTPDFYGTSTPATAYSGTNIISFLSNPSNSVTRTTYPG